MVVADEAKSRALNWLVRHGVKVVSLSRMGGYTNHVFLVKREGAPDSVLRLANHEEGAEFCPLAHDTARICAVHQQVAQLGLAPRLIATDIPAGVMWLEYAGEPRSLVQDNFADLRDMLRRLHHSGLNWTESGEQAADGAGLAYLERFISSDSDSVPDKLSQNTGLAQRYAEQLHQLGIQRGYADYPLVPVHGDLNPGNCLYDKVRDRWFIIDWDYAGMRAAEWDYAGLVVEHGWHMEQCRAFAPARMLTTDLVWFCAVFALLSWEWHLQRESDNTVVQGKWQMVEYWFAQL